MTKITLSPQRRVFLLLLITPLLLVGSCTSLDNLNQIQADWDQKHAPGTGITGSRLAEVVTILATYEATQQQRQIAEQRAREAHARMIREQQAYQSRQARVAQSRRSSSSQSQASSSKPPSGSSSKPKPTPKKATPAPEPEPEIAPAPPIPKRIAVEVPDERKQGASTVMLWDTASERLVGNEVYDLSKKPAQGGELALWSGASAQYVGTGR